MVQTTMQTIESVVGILQKECPNAVINSRWDTDRWFITIFKVGGNDNSPGLFNDLTPDMLGKINENSVKKMAGHINGLLGRAQ